MLLLQVDWGGVDYALKCSVKVNYLRYAWYAWYAWYALAGPFTGEPVNCRYYNNHD